MTLNDKVSAKEFFALLGTDISDISSFRGDADMVLVTVYDKDENGDHILVGPSFARTKKESTHAVQLVRPGRPEGTTVANGAAPKTRRKLAASD
jgi:hypothetical protein